MREIRLILDAAERLTEQGDDGVLATVVKVEGSTYRRPGARLLVTRGGDWIGGVSGGCLEGDLVRKAWWRTENGPALVTYDSTADDETAWQFGLGCNGVVHVLLERLSANGPDPLKLVRRCVDSGHASVMATVFRTDPASEVELGERLTLDAAGRSNSSFCCPELAERVLADAEDCLSQDRGRTAVYALWSGEAEVAFEVIRPPIHLIVFGAGSDAAPLVAAAAALGWRVTVVDRRPGTAHRAWFAAADEVLAASPEAACDRLRLDGRTAAVVMNHSYPDDRNAVEALLLSPARYIGVLGPRARTEKILADIPGLDPDQLRRLHAPIGLDVGADSPEEIAAAVVAQVLAVFADRNGGHLRDRPGPIHRREPARLTEAVS